MTAIQPPDHDPIPSGSRPGHDAAMDAMANRTPLREGRQPFSDILIRRQVPEHLYMHKSVPQPANRDQEEAFLRSFAESSLFEAQALAALVDDSAQGVQIGLTPPVDMEVGLVSGQSKQGMQRYIGGGSAAWPSAEAGSGNIAAQQSKPVSWTAHTISPIRAVYPQNNILSIQSLPTSKGHMVQEMTTPSRPTFVSMRQATMFHIAVVASQTGLAISARVNEASGDSTERLVQAARALAREYGIAISDFRINGCHTARQFSGKGW